MVDSLRLGQTRIWSVGEYDSEVVLDFSLRDLPGWVAVTLEPDNDPETLGKPRAARGFPVCVRR